MIRTFLTLALSLFSFCNAINVDWAGVVSLDHYDDILGTANMDRAVCLFFTSAERFSHHSIHNATKLRGVLAGLEHVTFSRAELAEIDVSAVLRPAELKKYISALPTLRCASSPSRPEDFIGPFEEDAVRSWFEQKFGHVTPTDAEMFEFHMTENMTRSPTSHPRLRVVLFWGGGGGGVRGGTEKGFSETYWSFAAQHQAEASFFAVDVTKSPRIAMRFHVRAFPTVVFFAPCFDHADGDPSAHDVESEELLRVSGDVTMRSLHFHLGVARTGTRRMAEQLAMSVRSSSPHRREDIITWLNAAGVLTLAVIHADWSHSDSLTVDLLRETASIVDTVYHGFESSGRLLHDATPLAGHVFEWEAHVRIVFVDWDDDRWLCRTLLQLTGDLPEYSSVPPLLPILLAFEPTSSEGGPAAHVLSRKETLKGTINRSLSANLEALVMRYVPRSPHTEGMREVGTSLEAAAFVNFFGGSAQHAAVDDGAPDGGVKIALREGAIRPTTDDTFTEQVLVKNRPVVVLFHSAHCSECRLAADVVSTVSQSLQSNPANLGFSSAPPIVRSHNCTAHPLACTVAGVAAFPTIAVFRAMGHGVMSGEAHVPSGRHKTNGVSEHYESEVEEHTSHCGGVMKARALALSTSVRGDMSDVLPQSVRIPGLRVYRGPLRAALVLTWLVEETVPAVQEVENLGDVMKRRRLKALLFSTRGEAYGLVGFPEECVRLLAEIFYPDVAFAVTGTGPVISQIQLFPSWGDEPVSLYSSDDESSFHYGDECVLNVRTCLRDISHSMRKLSHPLVSVLNTVLSLNLDDRFTTLNEAEASMLFESGTDTSLLLMLYDTGVLAPFEAKQCLDTFAHVADVTYGIMRAVTADRRVRPHFADQLQPFDDPFLVSLPCRLVLLPPHTDLRWAVFFADDFLEMSAGSVAQPDHSDAGSIPNKEVHVLTSALLDAVEGFECDPHAPTYTTSGPRPEVCTPSDGALWLRRTLVL